MNVTLPFGYEERKLNDGDWLPQGLVGDLKYNAKYRYRGFPVKVEMFKPIGNDCYTVNLCIWDFQTNKWIRFQTETRFDIVSCQALLDPIANRIVGAGKRIVWKTS